MSLLGKVIVFALKETARPLLEKTGEHIGHALGRTLGRRIDPTYEAQADPEDKTCNPKET